MRGLGTQRDRELHRQGRAALSNSGCVRGAFQRCQDFSAAQGRKNAETKFLEVGVSCSWLLSSTHHTRRELSLLFFPFKLPSCCFMFLLCLYSIVKLLYLVVGFTSKCFLLNNE